MTIRRNLPTTERRNPASANIDRLSTLEIVELINREDRTVPQAVGSQREKIAAAIEPQRPAIKVEDMFKGVALKDRIRPAQLIALGVETSLDYVTPAAVFVPTHSGTTARRITSFRLPVWIVAVSSQEMTCQRLQFSSGVQPVHEPDHPEDWNAYSGKWVSGHGLAGDFVILTEGPSTKHPEANYRMEVIDLNR